jgi:hypothetical protein
MLSGLLEADRGSGLGLIFFYERENNNAKENRVWWQKAAKEMKTIYCSDYETLTDIIDILIRDGYKITIEYKYDVPQICAYEINYEWTEKA